MALDNAHHHHEAGRRLAEAGEHGFAVTHHVLGAEESVKAGAYAAVAMGTPRDLQDLRSTFRRHEIRHALAATEQISRDFVEPILDDLEFDEEEAVETLSEAADYICVLFEREILPEWSEFEEGLTGEEELSEEVQWWIRGNELKNRGLYVDWHSEGWRTPRQLGPEASALADKIAGQFSQRMEGTLQPWIELAERDIEHLEEVGDQFLRPIITRILPQLLEDEEP